MSGNKGWPFEPVLHNPPVHIVRGRRTQISLGTAGHCCICIPGRAHLERLLTPHQSCMEGHSLESRDMSAATPPPPRSALPTATIRPLGPSNRFVPTKAPLPSQPPFQPPKPAFARDRPLWSGCTQQSPAAVFLLCPPFNRPFLQRPWEGSVRPGALGGPGHPEASRRISAGLRDALKHMKVPPPPPPKASSLCPATVPRTTSASFNGICNRQ